jgi:hypothetical protein
MLDADMETARQEAHMNTYERVAPGGSRSDDK